MSRATFLLFLASCMGLSFALPKSVNSNVACTPPFRIIGSQCLLIDTSIIGSWDEVRQFCHSLKGELVNIYDANILNDIFAFIKNNPILDVSSYWIGAYDILDEGKWVWSYNNTHVRMSTPLWAAHLGVQEPDGGSYENCAMLNRDKFYFVSDEDCDGTNAVICAETSQYGKVKSRDNAMELKSANRDCPSPFIMIGSLCLLIDSVKESSWADQRMLCDVLGGHIAKIDDANDLGHLYDYLTSYEVRIDVWLGGSDTKFEGEWQWEDGTDVPKGTPFWGEGIDGQQEPDGDIYQNCLALRQRDFFFFHDEACDQQKGVVCQYDI